MGALDGLEGRYVGLACWSFLFVLFIGFLSLYLFYFINFLFFVFLYFCVLDFFKDFH